MLDRRAVLFDALGTLVALEPPWPALRLALRERHGIELSEQDARAALLAEMSYYRDHHMEGADPRSLAELRRRCALVLREHLPAAGSLDVDELTEALLASLRFVPFGDAAPAMTALRAAGFRIAVVSNWDCSLRSILAEVGIGAAADAVVVSAVAGAAKPDPAIYRAALEALGCEARDAVFVGDTLETDVAGAQAAGMRALLLDRRGSAEPGEEVERIHSLSELAELLAAPAA